MGSADGVMYRQPPSRGASVCGCLSCTASQADGAVVVKRTLRGQSRAGVGARVRYQSCGAHADYLSNQARGQMPWAGVGAAHLAPRHLHLEGRLHHRKYAFFPQKDFPQPIFNVAANTLPLEEISARYAERPPAYRDSYIGESYQDSHQASLSILCFTPHAIRAHYESRVEIRCTHVQHQAGPEAETRPSVLWHRAASAHNARR